MTRAVILLILCLGLINNQAFSQATAIAPVKVSGSRFTTVELRGRMNTLLQENSFWSRNLMLCIIDTLPGKDQAMWRLIKNQEEISGIFKDFFGVEAGDNLTELFYSDLNFQLEVISASVTDSILAKEAKQRWNMSAGKIADYLHQLNPKWMLKDLKALINLQVDLTYETIKQRIVREYDLEVIAFDKMISNGNKISNMFSQGIIYDHPQKFSDMTTKVAIK